jgi:hypothetical protein
MAKTNKRQTTSANTPKSYFGAGYDAHAPSKKRRRTKPEPAPEPRPVKLRPGVWPERVPVLVAGDIARNVGHDADGTRHDLAGWLEVTFDCDSPTGHLANPCYDKALTALCAVIAELTGNRELAIWEFCADEEYSLKQIAGVWNEMLRRLGYDV